MRKRPQSGDSFGVLAEFRDSEHLLEAEVVGDDYLSMFG